MTTASRGRTIRQESPMSRRIWFGVAGRDVVPIRWLLAVTRWSRDSGGEHHRRRGASSDAKLVVHMLEVFLNRPGADGQNARNLGIRLSTGHPAQNLALSTGEPAEQSDLSLIGRLLHEQGVVLPDLTPRKKANDQAGVPTLDPKRLSSCRVVFESIGTGTPCDPGFHHFGEAVAHDKAKSQVRGEQGSGPAGGLSNGMTLIEQHDGPIRGICQSIEEKHHLSKLAP